MSDSWDQEILDRVACFAFDNMYLFRVYGMTLPTFVTVFLIVITRHIFSMLNRFKHMSTRTKEKHRILTRSLIIQALLPVLIVIIPFCGMMGFTLFIPPTYYETIS
ncbi:hypothetical protein PMAYCL1PPCAC_26408, partial [Pristionchus mayeri]